MAEETLGYDSMPGTPSNLEGYEKKKKKGLKKIISNLKKKIDPTPETKGRGFESMQDENGSEGLKIPSLFKRGAKDKDGSLSQAIHPAKDFPSEGFMEEAKNEENKPENNEKKQNFVETTMGELLEKDGNDAPKEESKPSELIPFADDTDKPNLVNKAEEEIDSIMHKERNDDPMVEYSKLEKSNLSLEANEEAIKSPERAKEDDQHNLDHKQNQGTTDVNGEANDQELMIVDAAEEKSLNLAFPPPRPSGSPPPLQEKEVFRCESLAEGLQKICLPWTVNKED